MNESGQGGQPPQPPSPQSPPQAARSQYRGAAIPPTDGRPVSFYLAIFLALLLFVSGGLNLVLLFFSAIGSATSGFSTYADASDGQYEIVAIGGDSQASDRLLRVAVEGAIAEGSSPVIGAAGGTVSRIRRALRSAGNDDSIKGVLLDINSPGGGVTDSDEIHRLINEFRTEHSKPVLALFGDVSASGGYYIAAACDRIMARPTTITGSIGVIMQAYNIEKALDTIGVTSEVIISESTPFKDIMSMTRAMRPEERAILTGIVDEMYQRFVDVVDDGRPKLTRDQVETLADGRIYSAHQARENGLVDAIGSVDEAYEALNKMCSIDSAQVVEHRRLPSLSEALFGVRSRTSSLDQVATRLLSSVSGPRFLYYWTGAR